MQPIHSIKENLDSTLQLNRLNITILALGVIAFIGMALFSGPAFSASKAEVREIILEEARKTVVPPSLALAVGKIESGFNEGSEGKNGARGIMQILPEVAENRYRIDPDDLWGVRENVRIGLKILESLADRSNGNWEEALASYTRQNSRGKMSLAAAQDYVGDVLKWERRFADELIAQNEVEGRRREVLLGDASKHSSANFSEDYSSRNDQDGACADMHDEKSSVDAVHDCLDSGEDGKFYVTSRPHRFTYPRRPFDEYRRPRHDLSGNIRERLRLARQNLDDFGSNFRPRHPRHRRDRIRRW
jgi:hypothetical protein